MSATAQRSEASIREEIRDLSLYLAGIPEPLKTGGAFAAYEARLRKLKASLPAGQAGNSQDGPTPVPLAARGED